MASRFDIAEVIRTYQGSDAEATKALYAELEALGHMGLLATNVFRACKASERAKSYRGGDSKGRFRAQAYERKRWAMEKIVETLAKQTELGIPWGWQKDPEEKIFSWVLYIETPTGQISFHTGLRGPGPTFPGVWDGLPRRAPDRVCRWAARLLNPNGESQTCAITQVGAQEQPWWLKQGELFG